MPLILTPNAMRAQNTDDPRKTDFPQPERPTTVPHEPPARPGPDRPITRPNDPPSPPPHEPPTRPQPGSGY